MCSTWSGDSGLGRLEVESLANIVSGRFSVVRVGVVASRGVLVGSFSGVFVRELILSNCSRLRGRVFYVSPLGVFRDGSIVYLWNTVVKGKARLIRVFPCRKYFFTFSGKADVCKRFLDCAVSSGEFYWDGVRFFISEIEVSNYEFPLENPPVSLDNVSTVKVEFRTPVIVADVFEDEARFLPDPGYLFSRNIGELYKPGRDKYLFLVNMVSAVLQETHNVWGTVRPVKCFVEDRVVDALTGYVKFFLDRNMLGKHGWLKEFLENILTHAEIVGVGLRRDIGFGKVTIKTK